MDHITSRFGIAPESGFCVACSDMIAPITSSRFLQWSSEACHNDFVLFNEVLERVKTHKRHYLLFHDLWYFWSIVVSGKKVHITHFMAVMTHLDHSVLIVTPILLSPVATFESLLTYLHTDGSNLTYNGVVFDPSEKDRQEAMVDLINSIELEGVFS
jgi:hypothetical protein